MIRFKALLTRRAAAGASEPPGAGVAKGVGALACEEGAEGGAAGLACMDAGEVATALNDMSPTKVHRSCNPTSTPGIILFRIKKHPRSDNKIKACTDLISAPNFVA